MGNGEDRREGETKRDGSGRTVDCALGKRNGKAGRLEEES